MPILLQPILAFAAELIADVLRPGHWAIDATVGNGHDTLRLAKLAGPTGHVYGFDVQPSAIEAAERRLTEVGIADRATLFLDGHERMRERLTPLGAEGRVRAAMFNLGYLPGGDREVTTRAETTLLGLEGAMRLITPGGLITVVLYPGHPRGPEETRAVMEWATALSPRRALVLRYEFLDPRKPPPVLLAIQPKPHE